MTAAAQESLPGPLAKPGAWVDLALTLPIFIAYHLGVVFLRVRNGTDVLTGELMTLAEGNRSLYLLYTASIGIIFAGTFSWLGRGQAFRRGKFLQIAAEGAVYAVLMRMSGAWVVGKVFAGAVANSGSPSASPFAGLVMSLGAGFYEELTFRVALFGLGAKMLLGTLWGERFVLSRGTTRMSLRGFALVFTWGVVASLVFSGVHYVGAISDSFDVVSFTFRTVLGLVLTLIFALRGFAAAVWAHTLYDVWVLVF